MPANDEWLRIGPLVAFVVMRIEIPEKGRDHAGHGFSSGGDVKNGQRAVLNMMADAFSQTIRREANG